MDRTFQLLSLEMLHVSWNESTPSYCGYGQTVAPGDKSDQCKYRSDLMGIIAHITGLDDI